MQPHLDIGNEDRVATAKPAPHGSRIGAGAIDLFVIAVLSALLIFAQLLVVGATLPVVCVTVVALCYSVLPLWLFKATVGMWAFGIQLVGRGGRSVELIDILVREMLGRGLMPFAFLATLGLSLVGGMGVISTPGLAAIGILGSFGFLGMVAMGHLLIFIREDGRGLADLLARSMVVPKLPPPTYVDEDDRQEKLAAKRRHVRNFAIATVILTVGTVAGPKLMFARRSSSFDSIAERTELRRLENEFARTPADQRIAGRYVNALYANGEPERAAEVVKEHDKARGAVESQQVVALETLVQKEPANEFATRELLEKYEDQGKTENARVLLQRHAEAAKTLDARLWYAEWLFDRDENQSAVDELRKMEAEGLTDESVYAYLGWALKDLGQFEEARAALKKSLEIEPDLEDVQETMAELDEILGPEKPAKTPKKKGPKK